MSAPVKLGLTLLGLALAATAFAEPRPWAKNVPPDAVKAKSPLGAGADVVAAGKEAYTNTCLPCHGEGAQGDGPAAAMIKPHPKPLVVENKMSIGNDGVIFWVITNGIDGTPMAALGDVLTEKERWQVIAYLHTLAAPADSGATSSAVTPAPAASPAASPIVKDPPAKPDATAKPGKQAANDKTADDPKPKKKAPKPAPEDSTK